MLAGVLASAPDAAAAMARKASKLHRRTRERLKSAKEAIDWAEKEALDWAEKVIFLNL
jgi:hypothetical protein